MDSLATIHCLDFSIVQQILFAELLLDQHLILFIYSTQIRLVWNDF